MNRQRMDANACKMNGNLDAMRGDMDANMQTLRGEMQCMGLNLQAGHEAMRTELEEVKGKMAEEIGTVWGEITKLRGSVKGVWSVMKAGKEDVTKKIMTVGWEVDKLGQGVKETKEGQGQLEKEMGRNATAIEGLRQSQQETRDELEAVKEGCRARHEEMTEIVGELGQRVETETREWQNV